MSTQLPAAVAAQALTTVAPAESGALGSPATAASASALPGPTRCENCGASVPGRYCGTCGQRLEPPVHSLWHFTQVAAEDLTHADSRLWRTLWALLFKPGFLTREFFDGRRARYLPPVRLYLVLSVVFFVWLAASAHTADQGHLSPEARAAIAAARRHGAVVIVQGDAEADTGANTGANTSANTSANTGTTPASPTAQAGFKGSSLAGDQEHCKLINYHGPWQATLQPLFVRSCVQTTQDQGRSLKQSLLHTLPRAMFLFLPLLAAVMMLLYWHPRHYYVEHLLFFVHNHACAFLVLTLGGVASALLPVAGTAVAWAMSLYVAWYLLRSMRVMYGQGRLRTFGKLALMCCVYLVAGSLTFAATALYAFMTL